MKAPVDNHSWTNVICPGDPDHIANISPCILDNAVFVLLALYMGLVIIHGWWKKWKTGSSHESRVVNLLETRLQSYPSSLQPLASTIQGLVLLICFACFFSFLYLVVLYHTDPDAIDLPFYLLPYSVLLPLAWFLNFFVLSAERLRNRIYTRGIQGFWFLALVALQIELYDRIITYAVLHLDEGVGVVTSLGIAGTILYTTFLIRYFLTWILVFVALFLERKVRQSIERRAYDELDNTESDEENVDDASVDHHRHRRSFTRRTTTPTTLSEDDLENGTTGTTPTAPSTPSDETLRTLLVNGRPKTYGTLPRRRRRTGPAQTSVPQSFTSSPHTNYFAKLRRLAPFMWPRGDRYLQALIVLCLLLLLAERIVNVLLPISYKNVVDALAKEGGGEGGRLVWKEILMFVGLRMLQGGVGFIATAQKGLWVPIGQFTTRELQVRMFEHLLDLSLRFHLNRKTGEILRVQDRGVSSIVTLLTTICFNIVPTLTDVAIACVYFTYAFDAWFGAIVLTTMTGYVLCTMRMTEWRMRYRRETNRLENEMEAKAVDALLNYETVKLYANEGFEVAQYETAILAYQKADLKSNTAAMAISTVQNLILQAGLLTGCLLCAQRVTKGTMTVGDFVAYIGYMTQLYGPLSGFGSYYRSMQKNFVDMEKMLDLMQEPIEVMDLPQAAPLEAKKGEVVFDNVTFCYDRRVPTLRNISFRVPIGKTVALVGESGSGKSTITRLLLRFFDVDSGRILIDGQDVRFVRQEELRRCIGVVPQETVLFNDTIEYNIRYGKINATDQSVKEAADAAQIHSKVLDFPDGYHTKVGERGLRLSGGEKQRVGIARTMLKNPQIVVLDEATSALDSTTERHIQASLRRITTNRTSLVIAHRLSTIADADLIIVLQRGKIVERGRHDELLRIENGVYRDMWAKQQEGQESVYEERSSSNGETVEVEVEEEETASPRNGMAEAEEEGTKSPRNKT